MYIIQHMSSEIDPNVPYECLFNFSIKYWWHLKHLNYDGSGSGGAYNNIWQMNNCPCSTYNEQGGPVVTYAYAHPT